MTLTFTKEKNIYVAECIATNNFHLEFEANGNGQLVIYSSNSAEQEKIYWKSDRFEYFYGKDFSDSVFPKFLRFISTCEIKTAEIIFGTGGSGSGEGGGASSEEIASLRQQIANVQQDIVDLRGDNNETPEIDTIKEW